MEKKTQGIILFLSMIILYLIFTTGLLSLKINILLWAIWIALSISFLYWLNKNTNFFKTIPLKERPKHRAQIAEEFGFTPIIIYVNYILGFSLIGIGIFSLFSNEPGSFDMFLGMTILGLIIITTIFFVNRSRKKKKT